MNNYYYLAHHGIKGQRWGIRRFQNSDGSLTSSGRKRYQTDSEGNHKLQYKSLSVEKFKNDALKMTKTGTYMLARNIAVVSNPYLYPAVKAVDAVSGIYIAKKLSDKYLDFSKYKKDGNIESLNELKKNNKKESMLDSTNPKVLNPYANKRGGLNNCTNCAIATDMRQRGYDVRARRSGTGRTNSQIESFYKNKKINRPNSELIKSGSTREYVQNGYDNLCKVIKSEGKNTKGIITLAFRGTKSGHAFNYEVKDGVINFYDGQSTRNDIDKIFSFCDPRTIGYLRTDDAEPSDKIGEAVVSVKEKNK